MIPSIELKFLIFDYFKVKTVFCRLAETQFIMRYPRVEGNFCGCPTFEKHSDPFIMPDVILDAKKQETNGKFFLSDSLNNHVRRARRPDILSTL